MGGSVILIVVESVEARASLNAAFSASPHHLVFASEGVDGFDRFQEVKPDLILADARAGRVDGEGLCRRIRLAPRGDAVPILFIAPEAEILAALRSADIAAADGVLTLPLDPEEISSRLAPFLAFGRTAPSRARSASTTTPSARPMSVTDGGDVAQTQAFEIDRGEFDRLLESRATEDLGMVGEVLREPPIAMPQLDFEENTDVGVESPYVVRSKFLPDEATRVEPPVWASDDEPEVLVLPRDDEATTAETAAELPTTAHEIEQVEPHTLSRELTGSDIDLFEEPADMDKRRAQLIEEPQISRVVPSVPDHRDNSQKRRIIQEPSLDSSPSGIASNRLEAGEGAASTRGLDESQLGKRLAKRVRAMFQSVEVADLYEILDVRPDASPEVVTRAYFDLALEFHPDRFFLLRSGDLKEKIAAIYRKVSEAYDTLSDPRRRGAYDANRDAQVKTAVAPRRPAPEPSARILEVSVRDPKAKKFLDLANAALAEADLATARLHLHLAAGYESNNPSLAQALERLAKMTRPSRA